MPDSKGLQFTVRVGAFPADQFSVVAFTLTEGLNQFFCLRLELASRDADVSAAAVLEQPVRLTLWRDGTQLRSFHGVVSEFAQAGTGHRWTRYEFVVEPSAWRLTLMHNSRIFQNQLPENIVRALLEERGTDSTVFNLSRTPEVREYCVQHRESDWAFIERLASEEGWHFRFDVEGSGHTLVIADHHHNTPVLTPATYTAGDTDDLRSPAVFRFSEQQRVRAAGAVLKDYTFRTPGYALMHEHRASGLNHQRDDYEHYDYPGRFKADASGAPFTTARLNSLRNEAHTVTGASNRPDFSAGFRVTLQGHDLEALNREWLLVQVTHQGRQPQALEEEGGSEPTTYSNTFQAIPADRVWYPAYEPARRPRVNGPQIAIVTGPENEEIHCDEYGRVKVRFPWDRYGKNNEHSSAWLRVSQDWSGGHHGFLALPRVGHEVIVSFLDGDPDQPIVTGRTYHTSNRTPDPLPDHKTRTVLKSQTHEGTGSNELRFEDEAGHEHIFLRAQKDLDQLTQNNRIESIARDSHLAVENDCVSQTKGSVHSSFGGERRTKVASDQSLNINGSLQLKAGNAWLSQSGRELHIKAGQKVVMQASVEITLKAGGSFARIDPSGVYLVGPAINLNLGGAPGTGSGQAAQMPTVPRLLDHLGQAVAPVALAEVGQRMNVSALKPKSAPLGRSALLISAAQRAPATQLCQKQQNGLCDVKNCPCIR